jgi:hypothetical protein
MKKVALILAGLLVMMLAGCGEGSSSSGGSTAGNGDSTANVVDTTVDATEAEVTTPKTPYNLSAALGTPPGLPN